MRLTSSRQMIYPEEKNGAAINIRLFLEKMTTERLCAQNVSFRLKKRFESTVVIMKETCNFHFCHFKSVFKF